MPNTTLKTVLEECKKVIATTDFAFPHVRVFFENAHEGGYPEIIISGLSHIKNYGIDKEGKLFCNSAHHENDENKNKKVVVDHSLKILEDDDLVEFCQKIGIEVEYLEEIHISLKATEFKFYNEDGDFVSISTYNSLLREGSDIYGIRAVDDERVELDIMHIAQTMSDLSLSEIEPTLKEYAIKLRTYACGKPVIEPGEVI